LPPLPLAILGLVILLELNHSIAGNYLTTINVIPFVRAALWSGLSIALISILLVKVMGVWALIVGQGVVQLAYNNWKWPIMSIKSLGGCYTKIILGGFFETSNIIFSKRL